MKRTPRPLLLQGALTTRCGCFRRHVSTASTEAASRGDSRKEERGRRLDDAEPWRHDGGGKGRGRRRSLILRDRPRRGLPHTVPVPVLCPVAVDVGIGEVEALTGLAVLRVDHLHQVGSVHLAVMVDVV